MRITFPEVSLQGAKSVKCDGCGKVLKRRRKFWQMLNQFNRLPDGTPKGRGDIVAELKQDIQAWEVAPETCQKCDAQLN